MDIDLLMKLSNYDKEEKLFGLETLCEKSNPEQENIFKELEDSIKCSSETLQSEIHDVETGCKDIINGENHYDFTKCIKYLYSSAELDSISDNIPELESRITELHNWGLQWKELCLEIIKGNQEVSFDSLLSTEALHKLNLDDL